MNARDLTRMIALLLAAASLVPAAAPMVQAEPAVSRAPTASEPVTAVQVDSRYAAYGFVFEQYEGHDRFGRFTDHELAVLAEVIEAYADLVGGPANLSALVSGPVRVRRDEVEVVSYTQAGAVIGLGRGAFDLALTEAHNYYHWGAHTGDALAQIVFGHEIGHRWVDALRKSGGRDWGDGYGENVGRGERRSSREQGPAAGGTDAGETAKAGVQATTLMGMPFTIDALSAVYHTPKDTIDSVSLEAVEAALTLAYRLALELDEEI